VRKEDFSNPPSAQNAEQKSAAGTFSQIGKSLKTRAKHISFPTTLILVLDFVHFGTNIA